MVDLSSLFLAIGQTLPGTGFWYNSMKTTFNRPFRIYLASLCFYTQTLPPPPPRPDAFILDDNWIALQLETWYTSVQKVESKLII
jgi:hypothetical protein